MRKLLREQSLSLVFLGLFVLALVGQAFAGWHDYNESETWHAQLAGQAPETVSLGRYLTSSDFGRGRHGELAVGVPPVHALHPRSRSGSSRRARRVQGAGQEGGESDAQQHVGAHVRSDSPGWAGAGGWRLTLYENSLVPVIATIWIWSWLAQSVSGWSAHNAERTEHGQSTLSWPGYLGSAELLADDAAELAVRVPRRRPDGGARHLPAAARLARVQAGRLPAPHDRGRGLSRGGRALFGP